MEEPLAAGGVGGCKGPNPEWVDFRALYSDSTVRRAQPCAAMTREMIHTMIQARPFQDEQNAIPKIMIAAVAARPPAAVLAETVAPAAVDGWAILMKAPR